MVRKFNSGFDMMNLLLCFPGVARGDICWSIIPRFNYAVSSLDYYYSRMISWCAYEIAIFQASTYSRRYLKHVLVVRRLITDAKCNHGFILLKQMAFVGSIAPHAWLIRDKSNPNIVWITVRADLLTQLRVVVSVKSISGKLSLRTAHGCGELIFSTQALRVLMPSSSPSPLPPCPEQ